MINCAYIFKDNIEILLFRYSNLKNTFSSEDKWELFKDLDQFLYQFNKVIIDFLSQKYPTIAHLKVILLAIKKDLEANNGKDYFLENVAKAILEKFNEYYKRLEKSSHIAAFLNSKYKKYYFSKMIEYEIQSLIRNKLE